MVQLKSNEPLISVVIAAYNYGNFLPKAIQSVLNQTYKNVEVIVVDDGSTDNTQSVVQQFSSVKYYYQKNKGLAAARNTGIQKSNGKYFVFLDADDWLEPDALYNNYCVIKDKPNVAFVSGNHYFLRAETNKTFPISVTVTDKPYIEFLQSNYIGMHAAVMFQRWVFNEFKYDENLKACEDYDLYLNITRKYPVLHHDKFIATYNFHASGLSHNYTAMINSIKAVFEKQLPMIVCEEEKCAFAKGSQQWEEYYKLMKERATYEHTV